ncbi:hypothetical protein ElyMa_005257900 [Elysia marginata]|uniref:Uncharacterized protein n=1 Tax=Elysia marginata TaxID=1093978 RepID=A0AAV4JZ43_9GAST|nr:hypothetical protein ElyMa_005257900 [Elysia marginata]
MSSDLRILLLGRYDRITEIGNSLLGRKVFNEEQKTHQRDSVALACGRTLHMTVPLRRQFISGSGGVDGLSDELVTDINSTDYHAVILSMDIDTDLSLLYPIAARFMLEEEAWTNFIKKRGIIVVRETHRFSNAQKSGEISVSFLDWMRTKTDVDGTLFQEVQERCLLFDTTGSVPLLAVSMLILVFALFALPYFLSVPANIQKEITALDKSQELHRYMEVKFEQTITKIQDIEKQLTGIKIDGHMKNDNHQKENQNDSLNDAKVTQDVVELFAELKDQLLKETAELGDNGERESVVWSMIRSLLVSLSLTLMLLLLVPYRVPAPWHPLLGTVLRELLFLQLMLLLLLSGVYAVWTVFDWI